MIASMVDEEFMTERNLVRQVGATPSRSKSGPIELRADRTPGRSNSGPIWQPTGPLRLSTRWGRSWAQGGRRISH